MSHEQMHKIYRASLSGEVAQWLAPRICSAYREVGGSNLLRVQAYAAPGSLSRMYKKLCMRVK